MKMCYLVTLILFMNTCASAQVNTPSAHEITVSRLGKDPVWHLAGSVNLELKNSENRIMFHVNSTEIYSLNVSHYIRSFALSKEKKCILFLVSDKASKPETSFILKISQIENKWNVKRIFEHSNAGRLPNSTEWISELGAVNDSGTVGMFKYSGVTGKGLSHGPYLEQIWRKMSLEDGKVLEEGLYVE